ncbi:MAG TPA: OsmC family protein [Bacteroidia bacterium]|nr:OsmC family protein [Bacteroidia bacterium]HNS12630.1 OsmC family protein [Bacteroidia bacterium]
METMYTIYKGNLRTESKHMKSGSTVITDAPIDNLGKGEAFSPTDLLCVSLASCMSTLMGIAANSHNIEIDGMRLRIVKNMVGNPRKVAGVKIDVDMPLKTYTEKEQKILEVAARTCPVALSLHPDLIQDFTFHFKN